MPSDSHVPFHAHIHTHTHESRAFRAWIWVRNQLEKIPHTHTHTSREHFKHGYGQDPAWEIPFTHTHTYTQVEHFKYGYGSGPSSRNSLHTHTIHTSRAFQAWMWVRTQLEKFLSVVGKACGWGPYENKGTTRKQSIPSICISVKNQLVEFILVVVKARAWGPYQNTSNTWGSGPGGVAFWLRTAPLRWWCILV